MATAAVPGGSGSASSRNVSDQERRWVVIGICLNKVLTPALRKVLSVEILKWYQTLVKPPVEIDKQTPGKHAKNFPLSAIKLNYDSINNNSIHKSPKLYDYAVKDPLSLAKLFMKPFMASITGFDHTMDTSAALSVICAAQPWSAAAAVLARKVRSDVRNEWAHCDFSHWTQANFQNALNDIESLIKIVGLTNNEEKDALNGIDEWKNYGTKLCFGNLVDSELLDLLRTEVGSLQESVTCFNEDSAKAKKKLLDHLDTVQSRLSDEISDLRANVDQLKLEQRTLQRQNVSTVEDVKNIKTELSKIASSNEDIRYIFSAPRHNPWFAGRISEIQALATILNMKNNTASQLKVVVAAISGLGGVGKTTLATEYAKQKKDFYTGGVYWFSGEDDTSFESSVYYVATQSFRKFQRSDSFAVTFSDILALISRNENPWLIVLDNMDELDLSTNIVKLISGSWQHGACGHLLITTRRKPSALTNDIRDFDESCCLSLKCFEIEEGKKFLFRRIDINQDDESDVVAEKLVQQLGGLPLALEQAGAYIRSLSCTLSEYLKHYESKRLRLLNRQKSTPVSTYESKERLAVRTTWYLNFEHIKQHRDDGKAATTFLYASAFFNPNEIQKDLINIGDPPIKDDEFNECVNTTLGCQQISKLLTDFSLFKEYLHSNLSVHHLVQEVIRDDLSAEAKIQTMVDGIRMLRYAFLHCDSPDDLLSNEEQGRPSVISSDESRFYKWHKFCLHSYEMVKHLKSIVKQSSSNSEKIFLPETARIVYECAIHLSANSKHDDAREVANFAQDIFNLSNQAVSEEKRNSLFPHVIPLPELVCRRIQYCCNAPATSKQDERTKGDGMQSDSVTSEQLENMRLKGNSLFKEGLYSDAMKIYSDAIDMPRKTAFFDVRLLSNRASTYLKLEQYAEALHDAEEYILKCPKCWKGYAKKAMALFGLGDFADARVAAGLAYYYERNIFQDYAPFKEKFNPRQVKFHRVCRNNSELSKALWLMKQNPIINMSGRTSFEQDNLPVIILEPGDYVISLHKVDVELFHDASEGEFVIGSIILVGSEGECSVTFDYLHVEFLDDFIAHNIHFRSRFTNCHFERFSVVQLSHCSFQGTDQNTTFYCNGKLKARSCKFHDCTSGGLLIEGDAEVENSVFYNTGVSGLQVREGGRLIVRKSKMYGNVQGLRIGPNVKECVVEDCDLYDNQWSGINVVSCKSDVTIRNNRIYHNDEHGITLKLESSNTNIYENEIWENSHFGISVDMFCQAIIKRNKIHRNSFGGVCVDALYKVSEVQIEGFTNTGSLEKSIIEHNEIFDNFGPGIREVGNKNLTKYKANSLHNNKDKRTQTTARCEAKVCYGCKKPEKNLKKCPKCFTAEYCGENCEKSDWKKHKEVCDRLLSEASVLLNYVRVPIMEYHLPGKKEVIPGERGPGLLPVGPDYCPQPDTKSRFILKLMLVGGFMDKNAKPSLVRVYDRSLKLDGLLLGAERVNYLVRQHGAMGQLYHDWKKLFVWAKGPEDGKLRVFINEFPPYQRW